MDDIDRWVAVCDTESLTREVGVAALLEGQQVAIFRTWDDRLFAVGNRDPYSRANIMSRGIVGTRGSTSTVASPMFKQIFDLESGRALDDTDVSLGSWPVRSHEGQVEVLL